MNPRYEFCPYTPLAGERLQPLGHPSVGFCLTSFLNWRRVRDSNPRSPCGLNSFQDYRIQPLCQPSRLALEVYKDFVSVSMDLNQVKTSKASPDTGIIFAILKRLREARALPLALKPA